MELYRDLFWVWDIYTILNSQRQVSQHGPQPLSVSDIQAVATMKGIERYEDLSDLLLFIPALDRAFLKSWHEEQEAKTKKNTKKPPVKR